MNHTSTQQFHAILFTDASGSKRLYETPGNRDAKRAFNGLLQRMNARAGQIITPRETVAYLAPELALKTRLFDTSHVKGKQDQERRLDLGGAPGIGRAETCELVVESPLASRLHARIEGRRNKFVFIDRSNNRSYVRGEEAIWFICGGRSCRRRRAAKSRWARTSVRMTATSSPSPTPELH